jgi:hypothetical protein
MLPFYLALALFLSLTRAAEPDRLHARFAAPAGFVRVPAAPGSFAAYLRDLPLLPAGAPVHLFDGRLKSNQQAHAAVVDLDVGARDLQQCADAIMRLRAEWLFREKRYADIHFNLTNGMRVDYPKWREGYRVKVEGNETRWVKSKAPCTTYACFRAYLDFIFAYAGTLSLARELRPRNWSDLMPGDVLIQGGSPGHAVLVADVARNPRTGASVCLLLQSYMPAQEIQVLKNPADGGLSPWYAVDCRKELATPEWVFRCGDLRTW